MSFNSILLWCVGGAGLDAQSSTQPQINTQQLNIKETVSFFVCI